MARSTSPHPTQAELEILNIIWTSGPSTVRQVQQALASTKPRAYTSVMTVMNIMTRKRYLGRRKATDGGYVYTARVSRDRTSRGMLRDLVQRVFRGSPMQAVLQLLDERDLDEDELRQLRDLINRKMSREDP